MPFATINDEIHLYYETAGDPVAPPLLLIGGLSSYTAGWWAQVPTLAQDFFVVYYDNRSAGKSSLITTEYSMSDMADDAAVLLTCLGIEAAHVFGVSMGGMIAQHVALRHPQRVRRLALGCTIPGGAANVPADAKVLTALADTSSTGDRFQDFLDNIWFTLPPDSLETNRELVEKLGIISVNNPQSVDGYLSQLQAIALHDVGEMLYRIEVPTLVMHGDIDILVPPENGRILAKRIPNAHLKMYPGAAHLYFIEQADIVNADLRDFFMAA